MKTLLLMLFLMSCSKEIIQENYYYFDNYKLIIDRYTTDTSELLLRTVWWCQDSVWKPEMKAMLDTMPDEWWLVCSTPAVPLHLDHCYYTKNDKKIQPSEYPKN